MISLIVRMLVLGLCFVASYAIGAEELEDIYQVDIIFFEHTDPKRFDAEKWPKTVGDLNLKNAVALNSLKSGVPESLDVLDTLDALDSAGKQPTNTVINESISLVEAPRMLLKEEANILKNSKSQRFIQQVSWMQPVATYVASTPIYIQAGKNNKEVEAVVEIKPTRQQMSVSVDLIFNSDQSTRQGVREYRVKKDFKLKRKEIYYIDHPIVGMMMVVTPVLVNN